MVWLALVLLGPVAGGESLAPLAQFGDRDTKQKPLVTLATSPLPGGGWRLTARYVIPPGMHQTLQEGYFGLELGELPPDWSAAPTRYPDHSEVILGLPSWSGTFELSRDLVGAADGPPAVKVTALWQICFDDGVCLPPGRVTFFVGQQFDWLWALTLALLGGLVLNLMPCVLPVLALKLMARPGRLSSLATALGIETGLLVLGGLTLTLQAGGQAAGWGFQFQSPWYSLVLIVVLVALALEWWGVWRLPALTWSRAVGAVGTISRPRKGLWWESFGTGLLTVALATPCTAPFLGTALGLTLSAPPAAALAVFGVIGLGLASPFLLMAGLPTGWTNALARWMPKPGAWMSWVPRLGGAALLGTALWLGTVVWQQSFSPAAGAAVEHPAGWEAFSPAAARAAATGEAPVLVEFTAAWCLTCRVNEAGPLSSPEFLAAARASGTRLFWGDFTGPDAGITEWLSDYGRAGVPFTLVLKKGYPPQVLPELLSVQDLLAALAR